MTDLLPDTMPPNVRAALAEAKARLEEMFGERLDRLVLYGSHARGDARADSDVDVLVVLRGGYEPYTEIRRMGPMRLEIEISHDVALSLQPYSAGEIANEENLFMRNVVADAIAI